MSIVGSRLTRTEGSHQDPFSTNVLRFRESHPHTPVWTRRQSKTDVTVNDSVGVGQTRCDRHTSGKRKGQCSRKSRRPRVLVQEQ